MIVYDSGQFCLQSEVRVSPFERAFLYGQMSFTTLRGFQGRFLGVAEHLQRLLRMAELEGVEFNLTLPNLTSILSKLCQMNELKSWVKARVLLWNEKGLRLLIQVEELTLDALALKKRQGIDLDVIRSSWQVDPWGFHQVKGYGYITRFKAVEQGFEDSLWIDEKSAVGECGTASLLIYHQEQFWQNSQAGLLPSITLELLAQELKARGQMMGAVDFTDDLLRAAEGVYIASSLRWFLAVKTIRGIRNKSIHARSFSQLQSIERQWNDSLGFHLS